MASQLGAADEDIDGAGGTFIPATQRPDGSWRKARRVKEGYVPQEEVPLYESKGKQMAKNRSIYPPGLHPDDMTSPIAKSQILTKIIPGMTLTEIEVTKSSTKKKRKKKGKGEKIDPENILQNLEELDISCEAQSKQEKVGKESSASKAEASTTDPARKLKNLKKKLREIENLEKKIQSGEIKTPEKEQLEKITRKEDIEFQIDDLEAEIENS